MALLLALVLAVWFGYELGDRTLWSPDEGRYAEIPREMLERSDYVTPRLNGIKYFEKPPLLYWLTAGAIRLLGTQEWVARLWPAIFAWLGCLTIFFLGRRLFNARAGLFGAIVAALSPLYDLMGDALTLDMPLTGFLTMAFGAFLLGIREPPGMHRRAWLYGFYAAIALAVLTKGLAGLAIPMMVIGTWVLIVGEWRLLRQIYLVEGALLFLAIAAPWHILASRANPEFMQFYFYHEHVERFLTTVHHRYQPAWFFIPVLLVGMFPWSALIPQTIANILPGLWHERRQRKEVWFLLLWAVLPFLFFSASGSKLVPYILPVIPPLALLLGHFLNRIWQNEVPVSRVVLWTILALGLVLALSFVGLSWLTPKGKIASDLAEDLGRLTYLIAAAWLLTGLAPILAARLAQRAVLVAIGVGAMTMLLTLDATLPKLNDYRSVKAAAMAVRPVLGPGDDVMVYHDYSQDLPYYLARRVTVVGWSGELAFGMTIEDTSDWMIDEATFRRRWGSAGKTYLFISPSRASELATKLPGAFCEVYAAKRMVVWVNRACGEVS